MSWRPPPPRRSPIADSKGWTTPDWQKWFDLQVTPAINMEGTQGVQGPQGVTGATGIQGPQGYTGPQGPADGPQGPQGTQGASGPQGVKGATGPQGTQGTQGPTGAQGTQGVAGPQGVVGPQGNQGAAGPQGTQGAQGAQGAQGDTGPRGLQGLKGAQGDTGAQGAVGPQGSQGAQGPQGALTTVDWTNPGTIGSSTPNTGAFTTLAAVSQTLTATTDPSVGAELITTAADRDFSSATGNWSGTNWSITGGVYAHTAGANAATLAGLAAVAGNAYLITCTVTTTTKGTLTFAFGGASAPAMVGGSAIVMTAYEMVVVATGTGGLTITPNAAWVGSIDNISVKQLTAGSVTETHKTAANTTAWEVRPLSTSAVALGTDAGKYHTRTNAAPIFVGYQAGYGQGGVDNVSIGYQAGLQSGGGTSVMLGTLAGYQASPGRQCVFAGPQAGYQSSVENSVLVGYLCGKSATGTQITAVGYQALASNTGVLSTAMGDSAGYQNTGTSATFIGYSCGYQNTGTNSVGIGYRAAYQNAYNQVTAVGYAAADTPSASIAAGAFVGYQAGNQAAGVSLIGLGIQAVYLAKATNAIGIGESSGRLGGATYAVMAGTNSGYYATGTRAIGIGNQAGSGIGGAYAARLGAYDTQYVNSIVLAAGTWAAAMAGTTGLDTARRYRIAAVFADGTTSEMGAVITGTGSAGSQYNHTGVPVYSGPKTCTSRKIYRFKSTDNLWYLVGTISDNTTTTYTDTQATATYGTVYAGPANTIGLGAEAKPYTTGDVVIGDSSRPVSNLYLGGIYHATTANAGLAFVVHGMGGHGTDQNGGDLTIASGKGTGSGTSSLLFQTPTAAASGAGENALATRLTIIAASSTFTHTVLAPTAKFGTSPNYSEFEADGTLKFNGDATVYNDANFNMSTGKVGTNNAPTWSAMVGNLYAYRFEIDDVIHLGAIEVPHDWLEGSVLEVHVHWATNGLNNATARGVKWEIEYAIANYEAAGGTVVYAAATLTQAADTVIAANEAALTHKYSTVGTFTPTGIKVGNQMIVRLKRITATGTAPASNPFVTQVGVHYQADTCGSRTTASK